MKNALTDRCIYLYYLMLVYYTIKSVLITNNSAIQQIGSF